MLLRVNTDCLQVCVHIISNVFFMMELIMSCDLVMQAHFGMLMNVEKVITCQDKISKT